MNTGVATLIEENWAEYGISAHTVAVEETGLVDYYVLDRVGGERIKVTEETPVYAVMNERDNNNIPYKYWTVKDWSENLAEVDEIIVVKNTLTGAIEYILVFKGTDDLNWGESWAYAVGNVAKDLFDAVKADTGIYAKDAKWNAFVAAVTANIKNPSEANYEAELKAFMAWYPGAANVAEMVKDGEFYVNAFLKDVFYDNGTSSDVLSSDVLNFVRALNAATDKDGNLVLCAYLGDDTIQEAYAALSETEKEFLVWLEQALVSEANSWINETIKKFIKDLPIDVAVEIKVSVVANLLKAYKEVKDADIAKAMTLIAVVDDFNNAGFESYVYYEDMLKAYKAVKEMGYSYCGDYSTVEVDGKDVPVCELCTAMRRVEFVVQANVILTYNEGTVAEFNAAWADWEYLETPWVDFGTAVVGEEGTYTNDLGAYNWIVNHEKA